MRALLPQQPHATHAVPCRSHPQAPADAALRAPLQRRVLLASFSGLLASRLAPQAHASGSPYDDVLPAVGVLNGCVVCQERASRPLHAHTTSRRRLQTCPSTFNCVSTSSRSSDQYTAPWAAAPALKTAKEAADEIVEAVRVLFPQAELQVSEAQPSGHYVRFHVPGRFSLPDELEFLVRNEGVSGRDFSGDEDGGLLVTLRSVAGTVQCALPLHADAVECALDSVLRRCSLLTRAAKTCTLS